MMQCAFFLLQRLKTKNLKMVLTFLSTLPPHQTELSKVFQVVFLRPVAQLYGQVRMDWNQCIVIDSSLSLPAGHKPFTRPHCVRMYHVTYQLRFLLNAFFCSPRCVRICDATKFCRRLFSFSLIWDVPRACPFISKLTDRFPRYEGALAVVKTSRLLCQELEFFAVVRD